MLKKYIKKWLLLIHVLKGFFPVIVATDSLILYTYQLTYVHTAIFYPLFSKLQEGIKKATPETCSAEWLLFNICIVRIVNIGASAYKHSLCLTGLYSHNVYKAVIVVHVFTPLYHCSISKLLYLSYRGWPSWCLPGCSGCSGLYSM